MTTATTGSQVAAGPFRPALRRTPGWWRDAAGGLTWASVVVVLALWVRGRGLQDLGSDPLDALGRLTGLVGSDLLLVQVLLMARLPWVERSYGQDELARRHRLVGFASFDLVVVHVVLITLGYAGLDRAPVLREAWHLVRDLPGMLLATAGTLALVMVVVTSVRRARARLRYESWHLLHLYAYLGVGLALPHQLWTGSDFTSPLSRLYWWSLWGAAAGAVLVCRLGLPAYRSARHRLVVTRVVREAPGVVSVHLTGRALDRLPVRGGQFFVWRFLDGPGWTRGHPYSLSAAPDGKGLRLTAREDPEGRLARLRPGTRALVEGPYGRLTAQVRTRPRVLVLASGLGITPGLALLQDLPGDLTGSLLVHRVSTEADRLLPGDLAALAARGLRVVPVVGPRLRTRRSWLPAAAGHLSDAEALLRLVPQLPGYDVYVCGPAAWTDAAAAAARSAGVPAGQLHVERFSW